MKIALFDYVVTQNNAIGKTNLAILSALCRAHQFTVFSVEFENPCPDRIRWVRVPAVKRPLFVLFITFHLLAPLLYIGHRLRHGMRFDQVQFIESNLVFGAIAYAHFCHRVYLKEHWKDASATGFRGASRWLDHWFHAALEPWSYRRASRIVVPSRGLARELTSSYPFTASKISILANSIDRESLRQPEGFDRNGFRKELGATPEDIILVFSALGHFERKGLPLLIDALGGLTDPRVKVMIVGGSRDVIGSYRRRADQRGLNGHLRFAGTQKEVRPYLWAADALILPSHYEVFTLVALEGAAAGLPLLVTPLNGVEEFLRDGQNGLLARRDVTGISECIARFAKMSAEQRRNMGQQAQRDAERYGLAHFVAAWSNLYREVELRGG
jgi:glycosyltransferase involved in cell wall biosynthesis